MRTDRIGVYRNSGTIKRAELGRDLEIAVVADTHAHPTRVGHRALSAINRVAEAPAPHPLSQLPSSPLTFAAIVVVITR